MAHLHSAGWSSGDWHQPIINLPFHWCLLGFSFFLYFYIFLEFIFNSFIFILFIFGLLIDFFFLITFSFLPLSFFLFYSFI